MSLAQCLGQHHDPPDHWICLPGLGWPCADPQTAQHWPQLPVSQRGGSGCQGVGLPEDNMMKETGWETLRKGCVTVPSTAEFFCPRVTVERQFWDSETVVWAFPGEVGWDVAIRPHLSAGRTNPLLSVGLSHISDTPASLSKAYSGGCAMVQLLLYDSSFSIRKVFPNL